MRIGQELIRPVMLQGGTCAFDVMQLMYKAFNDPRMDFASDLLDYARHGFVRISVSSMALAKVCRDGQGNYWFIRSAVGNLLELINMLPFFLPRIAWCRNNEKVLRMYDTRMLFKIVKRQVERKHETKSL